jgi:energy-coupling factor transporter ATP-binding protein EcfA2
MENYGSLWRKWDLHVHSPASVFNNQFQGSDESDKWEQYLKKVESLTDVAVLGVTDYWSMRGYKKLRSFKEQGRISRILLLIPNIELRILPVTGESNGINIHILVNPEVADQFETTFFGSLEFEFKNNQYKCTDEDLVRLGKDSKGDQSMNPVAAYMEGCLQFKTTIKDLNQLFNKNTFLKENCITAVSNRSGDGASGIQHSSLSATRSEVYRFAQMIFSSNPKDIEYFLGKGVDKPDVIRNKIGGLKPCIHGSDAHDLDKICKPDLDRFTFIKSDPTFEGLRQIIFEPEYRVKINNTKPIDPPIRLRKLTLNFPTNSVIGDESFCFKGTHSITFNPNFTVFIGGRGTGKSMVLNLVHEKLQSGNNKFFVKNKVLSSGAPLNLQEHVSVEDGIDGKLIDYLSQNEIEEFAKEHNKFTQAIYARIKGRDIDGKVSALESKVIELSNSFDNTIRAQLSLRDQETTLEAHTKSLQTKHSIINSYESDEYKEMSTQLSDLSNKKKILVQSKERVAQIRKEIELTLSKYPKVSQEQNDWDKIYNQAVSGITDTQEKITQFSFESADGQLTKLEGELAAEQSKLEKYLNEQGIAQENLRDISNASQEVGILEGQIERVKNDIELSKKIIDEFQYDHYSKTLEDYMSELNTKITELNSILESIDNSQIKKIGLELSINSERVSETIFNDFKKYFANEIESGRVDSKFDFHSLKEILLYEIQNIDSGKAALLSGISDNSSKSGAKGFLIKLLSSDANFGILDSIYHRRSIDWLTSKMITVYYDGKEMDKTSFGQRCTAALVILILLGNNPLIIDEPEAHLDSLLIADYIVDIIKQKKANRQIIFATHNANFVINGDADLVHILKADDATGCILTSTTIEDKQTRSDLLSLEGGRIAFETRENRYQLHAS